jgi:hypothetical protein
VCLCVEGEGGGRARDVVAAVGMAGGKGLTGGGPAGFADGAYDAALELRRVVDGGGGDGGAEGPLLGLPARTVFAVHHAPPPLPGDDAEGWEPEEEEEEAGTCRGMLPAGRPAHFLYGRGGPWRRRSRPIPETAEEAAAGRDGGQRAVLQNVAVGRPARLSSGGGAEAAVDGVTNVFLSVAANRSHAQADGDVGDLEWWEVAISISHTQGEEGEGEQER